MPETKQKILVVEDEADVLKAIADRLAEQGFYILKALDGAEALSRVSSERPQIVLLDLILPRMHGFEFLEKLRANDETKAIPVIVFSNLAGEFNISKARALGVADYFVKTEIQFDRVLERIRQLLG